MNKEKRREDAFQEKKRAAAENEVAFSWGVVIFNLLLLIIPLAIGWGMMVLHLEEGSYGEEKLIEPFYSWGRSFVKVYWLMGVIMLLGWSISVKFINDSHQQERLAMPFLGGTLMLFGIGFTIAYM
ncbi:hypothetical protein AC623_10400 [Bacillus sp. FJAT-27231]|uniref:hypothetical protein n=1 Tax=Bacillus sp. FJAT-27231 TaxID=1679168 RepID=UPI000670B5A2|nr:hypothetical protein [Bacillus sp. FJAT-27231]KMY54286.1 hypothetical protein AC623_10400 [Bacillus sp. FJAT-27231]